MLDAVPRQVVDNRPNIATLSPVLKLNFAIGLTGSSLRSIFLNNVKNRPGY
jgi:hypothetical protein